MNVTPQPPSQAGDKPANAVRGKFMAVLTLTALAVGCLVPFLSKPFHVDDPLFVWCARHVVSHQVDFYGFNLNWQGRLESMAAITQNPPLAAYYLAFFGRFLGWSEVALHAACLLPAVAVILGTFWLTKRFCAQPLAAALGVLCSPVFLLSSTSVMCDTLMLGFWIWAVYFWVEGFERKGQTRLVVAAVLITLSALTKYFGMCLIPLLLVYGIMKQGRLEIRLGWLGIPVLAMALYQGLTRHLYGKGLLLNAAAYAMNWRVSGALPEKLLAGLAFTGGCIILTVLAAPLLWGRTGLGIGAGVGLLIGAALAFLQKIGGFPLADRHGINWLYILQFSLFSVGGLTALVLAGADLRKHKDAPSTLLFLWAAGTFVFACAINWTVSGRNILPMVPPVACLVVRRLEGGSGLRGRRMLGLKIATGLSLLVALLVTQADFDLAGSARATALSLQKELGTPGATLWFEGHWGFQYYMEALGAKPIDSNALAFSRNDVIIIPMKNSYIFSLPGALVRQDFIRQVSTSRWIATQNADCGAGYYSDGWGPLPFVFGEVPPDNYVVFRPR
jgi:hypothetical protein